MATFNGFTVVPLPSYPTAPKSIEMNQVDIVGATTSLFTGQQQFYDWQNARFEWSVEWPLISASEWPAWAAFLAQLRGNLNVFQLGDPTNTSPQGSGSGTPVVNGATQTGFTLATRGWTASASGILQPGDLLQIGYRLYMNLATLNADGSGHATASIWPNLRESPSDGASISLNSTQGIWRLKSPARKYSVSVGNGKYFSLQMDIREAI